MKVAAQPGGARFDLHVVLGRLAVRRPPLAELGGGYFSEQFLEKIKKFLVLGFFQALIKPVISLTPSWRRCSTW